MPNATDTLIDGNDVSSYQPDWRPKKGQEFVGIKSTEGTSYANPYRDEQETEARKAGLVVLWYHFLHPGKIDAQVAYFANNTDIKPGDILVCDWEKVGTSNADKDDFIRKLKARFPKNRVILYCNTSWWTGVDKTGYVGDQLWIAYYSDDIRKRPPIQHSWLFWQWSQTPIDQNISAFTSVEELKAWAAGDATAVVIDRRAKVPFRGGWTCGCVATSLPLVEADMIKRGLIKESIDIFQLGYRTNVAASAGTHAAGGNTDVDQWSAEQIEVWWEWGWNTQHRTEAQGFMNHGHGAPVGCPHLSPAGQDQMNDWRNGRDGLIWHNKVPNWPGWINWEDAIKAHGSSVKPAADERASKVDKQNGDDELLIEQPSKVRTAKQVVKPSKNGKYQLLKLENSGDVTWGWNAGEYEVDVRVTFEGIKADDELMIRVVYVDTDQKTGKAVGKAQAFLVEGLPGGAGTSFRKFHWKGSVGKPTAGRTRRIRLEVANFSSKDITITRVDTHSWKG